MAAYVCGATAIALLAVGFVADAVGRYSYGVATMWVWVLGFSFAGAVLGALSLRGEGAASPWQRRLVIGVLAIGAIIGGLTVLLLVYFAALCGSGACS